MSAMETNIVNNAQDDKDGTVAKSALVTVNAHLRELYPESEELFDIVLMTNNTQEEYLRDCLNKLDLSQISIHEEEYISNLHTNIYIHEEEYIRNLHTTIFIHEEEYTSNHTKILYLTENPEKAENAINNGHAAAIMFPNDKEDQWSDEGELRVAFDGDGVLFSDESEIVFKKEGFEAFMKNEKDKEDTPLREGPLKSFLEALGNVERKFRAKGKKCPVLTYLVTSRNPVITGNRALKTLETWGLEITQAFFLSGRPKGPPLKMIRPHIFFDDQKPHIDGACELGIISAHVPYGIGYETYKGAAKEPKKQY
ncbi:hypothetical protein SKAU_G00286970 [Synaphobranchus kaupii]|uniref:Cytosolic 5'-nucleotidase 1A-like n=1 Tax=Synaphobranchus kaupii TaxID=118154 RepID=A0A9Q1EY74_SYNKA|nr:hypothetical protein SKAU_G00286970 [Synaphobranchus kaupii]